MEYRKMTQMEFEQFLELFGPCLLSDMNDTELLGMYHWEDMDELLEYMESHGYNDANHIWTIVDGDYGQYILQGWRRVNRTGMYILTTKPHNFEHNDKEFVWCGEF